MGARFALLGPDIVLEESVLSAHAVIVDDDRIEGIVPVSLLPHDIPQHQLGDGYLTPGLVDIHTHGAGGRSYGMAQVDDSREALRRCLRAGVTTVLPTLQTAPIDAMVRAVAQAPLTNGGNGLPRTPGVHLEGPYFAGAQRGAHAAELLRSPDDGSVDALLEFADRIRIFTLAPELPGAVELTERLVGLGIVASAGHTNGVADDLAACQRAGLSHVIHIFSGQSTTTRNGPWRRPGMLEATLASDDLTVEMIADGKHLPPTLMSLAIRCLAGRLCLVSDASAGAGLPEGSSYYSGKSEFVVEDGVGVTLDRSAFAGSTTLLPQMISTVLALGVGVAAAIAMVTSIPARAARLDDVGRIAPGHFADFALFDKEFSIRGVAVGGEWTE